MGNKLNLEVYYRRALNLGTRGRACKDAGGKSARPCNPKITARLEEKTASLRKRPQVAANLLTRFAHPYAFFQIRAKVSRDPIENGPANSAVYESEQVSFLSFFFFFFFFEEEKIADGGKIRSNYS